MSYILILEPDKILGSSIEKYLNGNGLKSKFVVNSQDAINLADKNKPQAIVLELAIPGNNGVEFIQELRSYSDWINVPIVIYSHIPQEDTGLSDKEWLGYGVHGYLYKPTKGLKNLKNLLNDLLENEAA